MKKDQQVPPGILIGLAVGFLAVIAWLLGSAGFFGSRPKPVAETCGTAGGKIWSNVRLYSESTCTSPVATVVGGASSQVRIRYDNNGSIEVKNRDVVANQFYVRADDPAIAAQQWTD